MEIRRDVFQAIADPTRRQIINMLSKHQLNLNTIAGDFKMSRQAISLHIKILVECGLVEIHNQGRERFCEAKLDKLSEVSAWADNYRSHWEDKIDSLQSYLNKLQKQRNHGNKK